MAFRKTQDSTDKLEKLLDSKLRELKSQLLELPQQFQHVMDARLQELATEILDSQEQTLRDFKLELGEELRRLRRQVAILEERVQSSQGSRPQSMSLGLQSIPLSGRLYDPTNHMAALRFDSVTPDYHTDRRLGSIPIPGMESGHEDDGGAFSQSIEESGEHCYHGNSQMVCPKDNFSLNTKK